MLKKLLLKINKKVRYTAGIIIVIILIIADAKCSQSFKEDNTPGKEVEVHVVESNAPAPEPSFDTYEELKQDYDEDTRDRKIIEEVQEDDQSSKMPDEPLTNKVKVIDESDKTMDDQTIDTEKEYDVNNEPKGHIKLETPEQEEGKEVKDTTKPGGKQNVGTWG